MKKNILVLTLILILVFSGIGFYFWQQSQIKPETKLAPSQGLPNPASLNCEEQGGALEIREMIDGQRGFCIFNDGSECEEWKFFNSECKKGNVFCKNLCGDGICQEIVCLAIGCPCTETSETCPQDCL